MRDDLDTMLNAMITEGWAETDEGSVDDLGHYAYINVNGAEPMVRRLAAEVGVDVPDDLLKGGWWIVKSDDLGFIHGTHYAEEPTTEWAEIVNAYADYYADDVAEQDDDAPVLTLERE